MTIADALKQYSSLEIEILLGHLLNKSKEFLYLHRELKLTPAEVEKLAEMAVNRTKGTPVAYVTGHKHFYGLNFKVSPNVLIPRPETEWIVEESLKVINKKLKDKKRKVVRVLDVGTGSGAIAVSIAFASDPSKVQVFATDISDKALAVAKQNANAAKVIINFSKHDLLTGVKGKFDIITANLPYVPESDYKKFYDNLQYEPKLALSDGTDDFILIKKLLTQLPSRLNKEAVVLLEIDPKAADLKINGYRKSIVKDLKGLNRFIKLVLK